MMVGWFGRAAIAAAGLCLLATSVLAQASKDVQKCESTTGSTLSKFTGSKSKCISKCIVTARKTSGPYAGCFFPYADANEKSCIAGTLKGAEWKAGAGIAKACAASCPTCYSQAQCTEATGFNPWVQTTEAHFDEPFGPDLGFPNIIWCEESFNGMTPTKDEAKCEDGVDKALVKFVNAKNKCYAKCVSTNSKPGGPGRGVCMPPNPADPTVNTCIKDPAKGAEAKAIAAINTACPAASSSCYRVLMGPGFADGFVVDAEDMIDSRTPQIACGSPSGAFVN
jgi:hypothetical protein